MTINLCLVFVILGLPFSIFYGYSATKIFGIPTTEKGSWIFHQFWLNFVGSLAGWFFAYLLAADVQQNICSFSNYEITFGRILTFVLAFIGVTGYMPATIVGLVSGVKEIFAKAAGLIK